MITPNLAKIERVDLREAWPNEARDFTPWLAENIAELGEALGMDLELQETEAAVGGYSLDVLATDLNQNRPVIIENQLEATNHDHLGKLLTYAAGYGANVVVWLTRDFRDEHRQALDWLNQRTGEDTLFFGVVVELWKIGDSLPAPHFKIVAAPNEWGKKTVARLRPRNETKEGILQSVIDNFPENHGFNRLPKVGTKNSLDFPSDCSGVTYTAVLNEPKSTRIEFRIGKNDRDWNIQLLENLEKRKEIIESEMSHPLEWDRKEGHQVCSIFLLRSNSNEDIDDDAETPANISDWMIKYLLEFKRVFDPHLADLAA